MSEIKAVKFDNEKPKMSLISSKFNLGLASVLTFGAKKYSAHNWRNGFQHSRLYDALQRHLTAWNDGEDMDPESLLHHLDHAACELMFLREMVITHPHLDDRYKAEEQVKQEYLNDVAANECPRCNHLIDDKGTCNELACPCICYNVSRDL